MRIAFIDGLRGIAALAVTLHHYNEALHLKLFEYGNLGVPIFFVLSGFVISMSIGLRPITLPYVGRFALRRAVRLDPPYWLSMAAVLVLGYLGAKYGIKHDPASVGQILAHMMYLQQWLDYESIQVIYWTLCYEVQFYLFLLLLLVGGRQWLGWLVVLTLALSLIDRRLEITTAAFMGRFWFCFALGALTYYCTERIIERQAFLLVPLAAALLFGVVYQDGYALTSTLTALAIYLVIVFDRRQLGSSAPLQFLGRISYSLYLTHLIFGWLALRIAERFVPGPIAAIFGLAVALFSAWVFYVVIEQPSVRLSRHVDMASASAGKEPAVAPRQSS